MKLGKLSLVAVMALGTSAFAIDNVKVNGEAKVWYQTSTTLENTTTNLVKESEYDMFDNGTNSLAEIKFSIGATADLMQNLSAGVKATALTTLGLENNLVGNVPANKFDADGTSHLKIPGVTQASTDTVQDTSSLDDQGWIEELWMAYTAGKTTAKVGRQRLDTPLAFSENWNVVDNTFEAAVLLNNDLPDTTLVGAWVGKHNGVGLLPGKGTKGRGSTVAMDGTFSTFGTDGAYAAGVINKSIANTTMQGWYYNVTNIADAFWLQADTKLFNMLSLGIQYAAMSPKLSEGAVVAAGYNPGDQNLDAVKKDSDMYAVKAAVDVVGVNIYAAYSSVSTGTLGFANVATGDKTMVYTGLGSIWMDGEIVAAPDTDAWKIGASTKMVPGVTLSASYCEAETGKNTNALAAVGGASKSEYDYNAWDLVAATKVGPVDLTAIYTEYEAKDNTGAKKTDTDTLRIIASLKF